MKKRIATYLNGSWYFITEADLPSSIQPIEDDTKPVWTGNEVDRARLCDWTISHLDWMDREMVRSMRGGRPPDLHILAEPEAIAEANCGNMEPLRKLYPQLARFLKPPKLGHWRPGRQMRILGALADIRYRIKAIWKTNGIKYRRDTAIEIAAKRWKVSENDVRKGVSRKKG